jgi:hypothetical protein
MRLRGTRVSVARDNRYPLECVDDRRQIRSAHTRSMRSAEHHHWPPPVSALLSGPLPYTTHSLQYMRRHVEECTGVTAVGDNRCITARSIALCDSVEIAEKRLCSNILGSDRPEFVFQHQTWQYRAGPNSTNLVVLRPKV